MNAHLKITPAHYALLKSACEKVLADYPGTVEKYRDAGLSDMRLNWDVLNAARIDGNSSRWLCDTPRGHHRQRGHQFKRKKEMTINPTPKVNSQYGAPMGRPSFGHGAEPATAFTLQRIPINAGGYDRGGAYWGTGAPLYWYCAYETAMCEYGKCEYCGCGYSFRINGTCRHSGDGNCHFPLREEETEISDYIRAHSREHAKEIIRAKYPEARFKR